MITGQENKQPDKTYCLYFKPVYLSASDVLTPETKRTILYNNEAGERVCGWKPL